MSRINQIYSQANKNLIKVEGPGWRLARDPERKDFCVLLGGDNWAIELSQIEWTDLIEVINALLDQHSCIKSQLMDDESIYLEIEKSLWWGCLDGNNRDWSLKLILHGDATNNVRGFEIAWPMPVAQAVVKEMRNMWDSGID